jgi:glyceraldehyde-3-phosphate dehydrogenase/erythrose-4-phosphate dehydrogenase
VAKKYKFSNSLICISLKKLRSIDDVKSLLKNNDLDDLYPKEIMEFKEEGYLKLYLDKKTHNLVALVHSDDKKFIEFTDEWIKFLRHIEPLELPKKDMTVDEVLEKINKCGMKSLTKQELNVLKRK